MSTKPTFSTLDIPTALATCDIGDAIHATWPPYRHAVAVRPRHDQCHINNKSASDSQLPVHAVVLLTEDLM